ncbi:MAG: DUF6132 family protein [Candidatus Neomarinimicrobiota bacterium]
MWISEKIKHLWTTGKSFRIIAGAATGALLGFAYYYFIGCNSGTCAITGNPLNSTVYGAMLGLLMAYPAQKGKK